jgi:hypothetical protein
VEVAIDIKPGSSRNTVNPNANGVIRVAILTTASFDAGSVDPQTVRFGRTGVEAAPLRFARSDVDSDQDTDLVLTFRILDTGIQCGDTSARLTGSTLDGLAIQGSDSVVTRGCPE